MQLCGPVRDPHLHARKGQGRSYLYEGANCYHRRLIVVRFDLSNTQGIVGSRDWHLGTMMKMAVPVCQPSGEGPVGRLAMYLATLD